MDVRALERRLSAVAGFASPRADLEQYATPADLAARLVHLADLRGDLAGRLVVDLGAGTGVLALGAATRGPAGVVGVERDPAALAVARENERRVDPGTPVAWLLGDAARAPLCPDRPVTVLMNPPFGAQRAGRHADRGFLATAADLGGVSYSVHNEGSRGFVEAFVADRGGAVTDAARAEIPLEKQFEFQTSAREEVAAEAFRVEW